MAVVVYDLGTNTFRWLARTETGRELGRGRAVVGLGEGLAATGAIAPAAVTRAVELLERWRPGGGEVPVASRVAAVATHALRAAHNRGAVRARLEAALGHPIVVVDPETEARLSYAGAVGGAARDEPVLLVDIGGGSTELVTVTRQGSWSRSLPVGVVTLARPGETVARAIDRARARFEAAWAEAYNEPLSRSLARIGSRQVVASCGTSSALAQAHQGLARWERAALEGHEVPWRWVEELVAELGEVPLATWASLPGIGLRRAPLIGSGIGILAAVLAAAATDRWTNAEGGLLEGAADALATESLPGT